MVFKINYEIHVKVIFNPTHVILNVLIRRKITAALIKFCLVLGEDLLF